jgi:hypothetical protein
LHVKVEGAGEMRVAFPACASKAETPNFADESNFSPAIRDNLEFEFVRT